MGRYKAWRLSSPLASSTLGSLVLYPSESRGQGRLGRRWRHSTASPASAPRSAVACALPWETTPGSAP
jgi:hypothetical protein